MLQTIENQTGLSGSRVLTTAERAEERSWQAGIVMAMVDECS